MYHTMWALRPPGDDMAEILPSPVDMAEGLRHLPEDDMADILWLPVDDMADILSPEHGTGKTP